MIVKFISWCVVFNLAAIFPIVSQDRHDRELAETSAKLAEGIFQHGKHTIAVVRISNGQNYGPEFSDYVDDKLSILFAGAGKGFEVVTRSRLVQIMDERRLKFGNNFDRAAFQQLGRLAGADAIIGGSYQVFGSDVEINLQVLDVSRGTIIIGDTVRIPRTKDIDAVLGNQAAANSLSPSNTHEVRQTGSGVLLPPLESVHLAEVLQDGFNSIGIYKCKKNQEIIVCFFIVNRLTGGNEDYDPKSPYWNSKLVDNFNIEHPLTHSYFVNGRGQEQRMLNFGHGDTAWLAQEFTSASPDIRSGRIVLAHFGNQLHTRVE